MQAGSRAWVLRSSSSTQASRLHRLPQRQQRTVTRAEGGVQQSTSTTCVATSSVDGSTYSRFTVSLKKPLGLILEEAADGSIRVAEVTPEGAAAKSDVRKGDQLLATTGVVYGKELDYQGVSVKADQQVVRLLVLGETFKTVSAAIRSHPGHMPVTLEFQRML